MLTNKTQLRSLESPSPWSLARARGDFSKLPRQRGRLGPHHVRKKWAPSQEKDLPRAPTALPLRTLRKIVVGFRLLYLRTKGIRDGTVVNG